MSAFAYLEIMPVPHFCTYPNKWRTAPTVTYAKVTNHCSEVAL